MCCHFKKSPLIEISDEAGVPTKIHAVTDENGLPLKLAITPGEAPDITMAADLLGDIGEGQMLLADRAYDADWLRPMLAERGAWANISPRKQRPQRVPS